MVLLAAFDCVDDTKLLSKAIVGEIIGDGKDEDSNKIAEIFGSEKAGRKVLLYLLGMHIDFYLSCNVRPLFYARERGLSNPLIIPSSNFIKNMHMFYSWKRHDLLCSRAYCTIETRRWQ